MSIFSMIFSGSANNNFTNFFSASNIIQYSHWKGKFSETGSNAGRLFSFNPVGIIPSCKLLP